MRGKKPCVGVGFKNDISGFHLDMFGEGMRNAGREGGREGERNVGGAEEEEEEEEGPLEAFR